MRSLYRYGYGSMCAKGLGRGVLEASILCEESVYVYLCVSVPVCGSMSLASIFF